MRRQLARIVVAATVAAAIGGSAAAFAAGGSGGGGGGAATGGGGAATGGGGAATGGGGAATGGGGAATGGGGGGGGATGSTCGSLTAAVAVNTDGVRVMSGGTSKSCDALAVQITFTDTTPTEGCTLYLPTYVNPMYFKYGLKPPSRYENGGVYADPATCAGTSHVIRAVLSDRATGAVYGTAESTWSA